MILPSLGRSFVSSIVRQYLPTLRPKTMSPMLFKPYSISDPFDARPVLIPPHWKRLVEQVNAEIQIVLNALQGSGNLWNNTLVIFASDHGDMDGAHKMEHKSTLYEEAANVPLIIHWQDVIKPRVDDTHLVSIGLDLLPTILDFAGVQQQQQQQQQSDGNGYHLADPRGKSLRPLLVPSVSDSFNGDHNRTTTNAVWRETLGVESQVGKMVVHQDGLKYARYELGGIGQEQLLNLQLDPLETRHFTKNASHMRNDWTNCDKAMTRNGFPPSSTSLILL